MRGLLRGIDGSELFLFCFLGVLMNDTLCDGDRDELTVAAVDADAVVAVPVLVLLLVLPSELPPAKYECPN